MTFFQMHLQNKKLCDYDDNNNNNNNIIQWTCFWRFILQLSEYDTFYETFHKRLEWHSNKIVLQINLLTRY